jgi:uncharacterized protein (DUF1697 family)
MHDAEYAIRAALSSMVSWAMATYIGLLRGVNVGGNKKVSMADLRAMLTQLGLTEVQTLLQSGNVVFQSRERSTEKLERLLESALAARLKLTARVLVRSAAELHAVIAANPFPAEAASDPSHLLVLFLADEVASECVRELRSAITGPERFEVRGRHAYAVFPEGLARSKLAGPLFDRLLRTTSTGRNWNTVRKLAAMVQ